MGGLGVGGLGGRGGGGFRLLGGGFVAADPTDPLGRRAKECGN